MRRLGLFDLGQEWILESIARTKTSVFMRLNDIPSLFCYAFLKDHRLILPHSHRITHPTSLRTQLQETGQSFLAIFYGTSPSTYPISLLSRFSIQNTGNGMI